ncbi:hypothetical protein AMTRI_Chr04g181980 [Amborella trichopoda]|uniref:reticuline oxidase n=1 Tax=Amborella trichopoda TaxID=13333 RepID=UPI0005D41898|nr:reticuline oxidase [Amborella trichopoda]|eukprot:XP_011626556.1 reticuline oxidase [Amborella trichopoda]
MATLTTFFILALLNALLYSLLNASPSMASTLESGLLHCFKGNGLTNYTTFTSTPQIYYKLLNFSLQNLRFAEPSTSMPYVIVLPSSNIQVQRAVVCSRQHWWLIRTRCGGHSYEGFSSTGDSPFVIIDLMNLNKVEVDVANGTAWIGGGATLGEIYYHIAKASKDRYGFSAGSCHTVGSGGHISGGGFGLLSRKFGLAADNILDALVVNADGLLLDRTTMGNDMFWAIRGGGGGSWGIIVAWKLKLADINGKVTVFQTSREGKETVVNLVHKWQVVAHNLPNEFYLSAILAANSSHVIGVSFLGMYLGGVDDAVKIMRDQFRDLAISKSICTEMAWIDSILYFSGGSTREDLLNRYLVGKSFFKGKSDYVKEPLNASSLEGAIKYLEEEPSSMIILDPYGGKMDNFEEDHIPFPHRKGNLYSIQYIVTWQRHDDDYKYMNWIKRFYDYMEPYVSKSPREAYVNYLDIDLGAARNGTARVETARKWGKRYFKNNFDRLVTVKSHVDPHNVFRNPQGIPVDPKQVR